MLDRLDHSRPDTMAYGVSVRGHQRSAPPARLPRTWQEARDLAFDRVPLAGRMRRWWRFSLAADLLDFVRAHRRLPNYRRTGYLNDLLFHLKRHADNPVLRAFTTDKELAKIFLKGLWPYDCTVPTWHVLRTVEDIGSFAFPPECVLKPTHMSQQAVFLGAQPITDEQRARLLGWMRADYSLMTGERNYRHLEPKILVEPWLRLNGADSFDYKVYVSRGTPTVVEVITGRRTPAGLSSYLFTPDWAATGIEFVDMPRRRPASTFARPARLDEMIAIAEAVGRHFGFVRVDFFTDAARTLYVGEISHILGNCVDRVRPVDAERCFLSGVDARYRQAG